MLALLTEFFVRLRAAFAALTNTCSEQTSHLDAQIKVAAERVEMLGRQGSAQVASVAALQADLKARTASRLLGQDAATLKQQQLVKLNASLNKLASDVSHLEGNIAHKQQDCQQLETERDCLEKQRDDLLATIATTKARVAASERTVRATNEQLETISNECSGKLARLGVKTRPSQQLKSVLKAIAQASKQVRVRLLGAQSHLLDMMLQPSSDMAIVRT